MKSLALLYRSVRRGTLLPAIGCALFFAFSMSLAAYAGTPPDRAAKVEQRFDELVARLQLTDSQKAPVKEILKQGMERRKEVLRKNGVDGSGSFADLPRKTRWAIAKEMRGIREETDEKLKGVLTPPQFKEFCKIRDEKREEMKEAFQAKSSAF